MLHIESPHQGIYTPLSQAMTDSDSEEQLFLRHQQPNNQNKRLGNRNPPDSLALSQHHPQLLHFKRQQESQRKLMQKFHAQTSLDNNLQQPSSYTTNMQNTFRSVMSDCGGEPGSNFSSFNNDYDDRNTADNVAILGTGGDAKDTIDKQPMSTPRRCCLVLSLLLCFFAVISFIWLVPCSEECSCPAAIDRVKTHNWLSNYTKIELKGGVNVVNGLRSWENNLIFLYRGDSFFPEFRPRNTKRNGIISLIGRSGAVAWYDEMHDEPIAIDCTLLDVDRNGQTDCLVLDEYGELGIINPISGQWHWRYKERSARKIDPTDFPVILPDLDGDGVLEILVVTSADLGHRTKTLASRKGDINLKGHIAPRNFLRILSGRLGVPIGEGFEIHECDSIRKLQLDGTTQTVSFRCVRNDTESHRSKTLVELFALITNKSLMGVKMVPATAADISQHHQFGQRKNAEPQGNIYSLSGRELLVENRGKCPENCNVTFMLSDSRNSKVEVLYKFTQVGMYGMAPVQWHFKNSKPEMSGFVMKFWKWNIAEGTIENSSTTTTTTSATTNTVNISKNTSSDKLDDSDNIPKKSAIVKKIKSNANLSKDNATKSNKNKIYQTESNHIYNKTYNSGQLNHVNSLRENNFDKFDHLIQKREAFTFADELSHSGTNVNISKSKPNTSNTRSLLLDTYKMEVITETVMVVFFGADTHIENTSQSSIIQFCRSENNELTCQPDLNNQENSILIADLDQDGSQELVSYTSTFVEASDDPVDYKLVTYVRLLRLESELPAFYSMKKNN